MTEVKFCFAFLKSLLYVKGYSVIIRCAFRTIIFLFISIFSTFTPMKKNVLMLHHFFYAAFLIKVGAKEL